MNADIKKLREEIVVRLKPLEPDKIILFGSYAHGTPTEGSDIDIIIIKDIEAEKVREIRLESRKRLRDLQFTYKLGFDIVVDNQNRFTKRIKVVKDQFYEEILSKGTVIYAK